MAYYEKHTSTVSVLKLDDYEVRAISGSWDKSIVEWDLQTGTPLREFKGSSGQISSIEWQPVGGTIVEKKDSQGKHKNTTTKKKRKTVQGSHTTAKVATVRQSRKQSKKK